MSLSLKAQARPECSGQNKGGAGWDAIFFSGCNASSPQSGQGVCSGKAAPPSATVLSSQALALLLRAPPSVYCAVP